MDASPVRYNPLDDSIAFEPPLHVHGIGWEEHIPFAMALMSFHRPRKLVELGVHTGDSYLAFCQAAQRLGVDTICWGVDTWKGDAHAGFYGDQILAALRPKHAPYEKFSTLMQMTFDDALGLTEDDSEDLLHIDGFHAYEAVTHDFKTWLPKVSKQRGIVLFHDIRERSREFGVWKFWAEVEQKYEGRTFAFDHGHGLGVLFVGSDLGEKSAAFLEAAQDPPRAAAVRSFFATIGGALGARGHIQRLQANLVAQQSAARPSIPAQVEREFAALKSRMEAIDALLRAGK